MLHDSDCNNREKKKSKSQKQTLTVAVRKLRSTEDTEMENCTRVLLSVIVSCNNWRTQTSSMLSALANTSPQRVAQ